MEHYPPIIRDLPYVIYPNETNANDSDDSIPFTCIRTIAIKKETWYQFMLIPASLCVLLFAFLRRRKNKCPDRCHGRPALPRPLHFLDDKHNRLFFVGGFSVTVWMLHEIIIGNMLFGISIPHVFLDFWIRVFSSILVGIICYPIFGGVTSEHVIGYAVGTVYVWALTLSFVIMNYPCEAHSSDRQDAASLVYGILHFIKFLPCFFWLLYLCLIYPYRFVAKVLGKKLTVSFKEGYGPRDLPYVIYVRRLLSKKVDPTQAVATKKTIKDRMLGLVGMIYQPVKGFRYSVSILSGVFVSVLLVYVIAITMIEIMFRVDGITRIRGNETDHPTLIRVERGQRGSVSMYVSVAVAFFLTTISMLSMLKQHRKNLLHSYQGHMIELPSYKQSPRDVIVDGIRYVGCQFAFAVWGFVLQTVVIALLLFGGSSGAVVIVTQSHTPQGKVLIGICATIAYAITLLVVQHLIVHFFFQQRDARGKRLLAVDNRSCFVNFQYFMIFANATVGLMSCLLRVLKAIAFSLWVLPRLDRCALSRQFERHDKGYTAYIGLLKLESAQTNPTVLAFVYLLLKVVRVPLGKTRVITSVLLVDEDDTVFRRGAPDDVTKRTRDKRVLQKRIRNRWLLLYTLERNPGLRQYRKSAFSDFEIKDKKRAPEESPKSKTPTKEVFPKKKVIPKSGRKMAKDEKSRSTEVPSSDSLKTIGSAGSDPKAALAKDKAPSEAKKTA